MKNYTTQTAALKAVTIDTHLLDAHKIDTKKLYINGQLLDPSNLGGIKVWNGKWSDCSYDNGKLKITSLESSAQNWMPHKIYINGKEIACEINEGAEGWEFCVAESGDDLSQIYGGITDDSNVTIYYSLL